MVAKRAIILIVEDEALVRQIGADFLEQAGYQVIEAETADEALPIIKENPAISLIFTDVRMPGKMDGLDLAAEVYKRWPHIRLLVTSGHCHLSNDDIPDQSRFLPKPYRGADLIHHICTLIPCNEA